LGTKGSILGGDLAWVVAFQARSIDGRLGMAGSDHLKSFAVGRETLDEVYNFISESEEADLQQWWVLGQPAPDSVIGSLKVSPGAVSTVVSGILEAGSSARLGVTVFPLGIPNIDQYQVDFGTFSSDAL
jgi:hypothetical protein